MQKILKLTGVSMLAIAAVSGAHAAGYTCEELIEYTSCNPGYALSMGGYICPDGYVYKTGICYDQESYYYGVSSLEACEPYTSDLQSEWWAGACVKEDALQEGCDSHCWIANFIAEDEVIFIDGYTPSSCNECLAGYYCAGGTDAMTPCAAGSYCATAGLSQPTGKCAVGSYAGAGAVSCMSCPSTGLTDINGAVVNATTLSAGAASISACIVGPDAQFKDDAGIYHFKSNCEYDIPTFEEACLAYQKANPDTDVNCNTSDPDYWPYCDLANGTLVYDETTGAIGCHVDDGSMCGGDTDLGKIKTNCALTGGVYNPNTTYCECPSGTTWTCNDSGYSDKLGQEWGCFNM